MRRSQHLLVKPHLQGRGAQKEIGPTHLCLLIFCLEKPGSRLSLLVNSEPVQHSSSPVNLRGRSPNKSGKEPLRPPPPKRASSQPLSSATAKRTAREAVAPGTPQVTVAKAKTNKAPPPGVLPCRSSSAKS